LDGVRVVTERRVPTPHGATPLLDAVVGLVDELIAECRADLIAVGVGMAGLVDRDGVMRLAPNLDGIDGVTVSTELEARVAVPVAVDNDATCATWGEYQLGAGRGFDDLVMITLGTGIGSGIISGGRLCRGANGFGGEVGHMVVDPSGPQCPCGQRGCWERFASGSGLGRLAREVAREGESERVVILAGGDADEVRGEHVSQAAAEGDPVATNVMARFAWWVSLGLVNLANILDPSAFLLGGGLVAAGDALLEPTRATFAKLIQGSGRRPNVQILPAALGERAGAVGAACLALSSGTASAT
jgi:glucokinase